MSAKHQENDTPVKASHLLLVIAVCQVLVPEHCLLGEPPKHEKFVSFHKSSVEWWPFVTYLSFPRAVWSTVSFRGNGMLLVSRLRPWQQQSAAYFVSLAEPEDEIPLPPWFLAKEFSPNQRLCQPKSLLKSSKKQMGQSPQHALGHPGLPNH